MDQLEREEELLDQRLADGLIANAEHKSAMLDLQRDCREAAEEAAQDAYRRELEAW